MTRNCNRMQEATDRLMSTFQRHASVLVTYKQGDYVITGVPATIGRTPYEVQEGEVWIAHESRDYIIKKTDLIADGTQLTPASGDLITEADGLIYEATVPRPNYVYESIGPSGSVYKIHTLGPVNATASAGSRAGREVTIESVEVDATVAQLVTVAQPMGYLMQVKSVGIYVSRFTAGGAVVQPQVQWGTNGNTALYFPPTPPWQCATLTGYGLWEDYDVLNVKAIEASPQAEIVVPGSGPSIYMVKFRYRGVLV